MVQITCFAKQEGKPQFKYYTPCSVRLAIFVIENDYGYRSFSRFIQSHSRPVLVFLQKTAIITFLISTEAEGMEQDTVPYL